MVDDAAGVVHSHGVRCVRAVRTRAQHALPKRWLTTAPSTPNRWNIDTRYYTADVELKACAGLRRAALCSWSNTPWASFQALEAKDGVASHASAATYEAVILAYEAGQVRCAGVRHTRVAALTTTPQLQESSLTAVTHWFATHGDSHGVSDAEVRLCVAVTPPAAEGRVETSNSGAEDADDDPLDNLALQWCIDHGFEHVPATPPPQSEDGERVGVARVREALHAHTWPGLVAKPRGGGGGARPVHKPAVVEAAAAAAAGGIPGEEDGADEGSHERFEVLMAHMMRARDSAGSVPDEVRRATAAELALRMAQLLGVDDGEGDSDSEGEEGGEVLEGRGGYQPLVE